MNTIVIIQSFEEKYADAVAGLIVPIQQIEFGVPVTLADQPDLQEISTYYFKGNGHFWVALMDGNVVGTIGLLDYGSGGFALRKMFVAKAFRGPELGIAQQLLNRAIAWVEDHGGHEIYLGTVAILKAAIRFYQRNGFEQVEPDSLPADFPRMAVDTEFFRYCIKKPPMIKINKLQHVGIPVRDMRVALSFYQGLGFEETMQSPFELDGDTGTCVMMKHGEIIIELYQLPEKFLPAIGARMDGHIDHIAFDVQDIDQVYATLKSAGYAIFEPAPVWLPFWKNGCKYFNIAGPNGERLEFNEIL